MRTWVAASVVLAGDLDDLDALGREVLLDLGQELLDLLGGEVVDRDGFEEVLRRDEATLPPLGGDGFLDLVQTHRHFVAGRAQPMGVLSERCIGGTSVRNGMAV